MLAQDASAQAAEKTVITGFNSKLAAKATAFKSANSGVATWLYDSNAAFTTILNSPTSVRGSFHHAFGISRRRLIVVALVRIHGRDVVRADRLILGVRSAVALLRSIV